MEKKRNKNKIQSSIIGVLTGFINGLLGSGGGTILVPSLERILHVEEHKSHATAIGVILPLSIISSIIYVKNGMIDWNTFFYVVLGGTAGGFVGARLLYKISAQWLHRIFGLFMIVAALRMILS